MPADTTLAAAVDLDDEPYDSAEDEDFQLEGAQDDSDLTSGDEEEAEPAKKKRKSNKKAEIPQEEDLDSGDEATIRKAREKREKKRKGKKSKGKQADDDDDMEWDDEEGGTGGFVRTRAMKQHIQEEQERKPLAKIDGATVDVNALWEQMNTPQNELGIRQDEIKDGSEPAPEPDRPAENADAKGHATQEPENDSHNAHDQMIKIKRTYKFAGEMITEEKTVLKNSAEAKAFLSSGENVEFAEVEDADANRDLRRPLRKISRFDPNPTGTIKKSWERQPLEAGGDAAGPKINTVEKSRLDWAQYVDQAGIQDELRVASKAKEGYMGRMDFLDRMGAKRDEEARQARLKGM
ncbi:Craniofacial development protein 1/Bucentaur [Penicillium angulare]|uniref:Craniofacial development protein 1/Bucentaur n=1 Tax=Penicillium angulare TaxID=116970 RepID=UPI0025415CE7|nr:Craniofacial development protein 1/Bucentaur [Penicillium angulare]KAJ5259223.1 Craniofacial development protein 1/Bucentaur [Penicillium angulare]